MGGDLGNSFSKLFLGGFGLWVILAIDDICVCQALGRIGPHATEGVDRKVGVASQRRLCWERSAWQSRTDHPGWTHYEG